ncbi:hypothetical protein [Corynebacterium sp. HMSC074H12]|uniref:hypothetical protein n=1 Tax=Corynebacterium sp. HMSC074H12 TaxID=1739436 RepID=UPI0008C955A1|nr:hypothetical protein [Corynebacterium sp. HMSC074H12]OFQ58098.1 hypothetical protein HMPREF2932_07365 [Corynebacterium sp. HMSC074H12]
MSTEALDRAKDELAALRERAAAGEPVEVSEMSAALAKLADLAAEDAAMKKAEQELNAAREAGEKKRAEKQAELLEQFATVRAELAAAAATAEKKHAAAMKPVNEYAAARKVEADLYERMRSIVWEVDAPRDEHGNVADESIPHEIHGGLVKVDGEIIPGRSRRQLG